jgi:YD repeat-containing protein
MIRASALAALLLATTACIPEEGPMMEPGSNCLECHGGGGGEESGPRWTLAGTWDRQGNRIAVRDAAGKAFTLTANRAGNFWTAEPLAFPLQVSVDGQPMPGGVTSAQGSCNRCHQRAGATGGGGD